MCTCKVELFLAHRRSGFDWMPFLTLYNKTYYYANCKYGMIWRQCR